MSYINMSIPKPSLGEIISCIGAPASNEYLPAGVVVQRSAYPELSAAFPHPKMSASTYLNLNWTLRSASLPIFGIPLVASGFYGSAPVTAVLFRNSLNALATLDGGLTWIRVTLPVSANWQQLTWSSGVSKFVVTSYNSNVCLYSQDGLSWKQGTMPQSDYWCGVAGGVSGYTSSGRFVAVTNSGNDMTAWSLDGITWTLQALPTAPMGSWTIGYGAGLFLACQQAVSTLAYTSPDGITWTARTLIYNGGVAKILWNGNIFICIAGSGASYQTSPDGITWTQRSLPAGVVGGACVNSSGHILICAGTGTTAYYSTDGITWATKTLPASFNWYGVGNYGPSFITIPSSATNICTSDSLDSANMVLGVSGPNKFMRVR